jgi:hypothetical protein
MNENLLQKKEWVKPEMVDLDVEKTADGRTDSQAEACETCGGFS